MTRTRSALLALPLAALLLAACGDDDKDSDGTSAPATQPAATGTPDTGAPATGGATVQVGATGLGDVLVDANGRTLYLFTNDTPTSSACGADCQSSWPPLIADAPTAGDGVDATLLGTLAGDAGAQVTYNGHPLYYFAGDLQAGDTNGQDVGGVWYVVSPAGDALEG